MAYNFKALFMENKKKYDQKFFGDILSQFEPFKRHACQETYENKPGSSRSGPNQSRSTKNMSRHNKTPFLVISVSFVKK